MDETPQVVVSAEGSVQVPPDRATLTFRVRSRDGDRQKAVQRATARLAQLNAVLDRFKVPGERRRTQAISATELIDPKSRKRIGFEAETVTAIRLEEFSELSEIYHAAATGGDIDVSGPQWEVSAVHAGHLEACRRAARTAQRRAEAMATGAGVALGPLLRLEELSARGTQMTFAYTPPPPGDVSPGDKTTIDPGFVRLSVSVRAVYALR